MKPLLFPFSVLSASALLRGDYCHVFGMHPCHDFIIYPACFHKPYAASLNVFRYFIALLWTMFRTRFSTQPSVVLRSVNAVAYGTSCFILPGIVNMLTDWVSISALRNLCPDFVTEGDRTGKGNRICIRICN